MKSGLTLLVKRHATDPLVDRRTLAHFDKLEMPPCLTGPCARTAIVEPEELARACGVSSGRIKNVVCERYLRRSGRDGLGLIGEWAEEHMFGKQRILHGRH